MNDEELRALYDNPKIRREFIEDLLDEQEKLLWDRWNQKQLSHPDKHGRPTEWRTTVKSRSSKIRTFRGSKFSPIRRGDDDDTNSNQPTYTDR